MPAVVLVTQVLHLLHLVQAALNLLSILCLPARKIVPLIHILASIRRLGVLAFLLDIHSLMAREARLPLISFTCLIPKILRMTGKPSIVSGITGKWMAFI